MEKSTIINFFYVEYNILDFVCILKMSTEEDKS